MDTTLDILESKAIDAALEGRWDEAIKYNEEILNKDKNNVDALLRIGFAFLQLKEYKKAKKYYKRVVNIQPNNHIATQNLKKINLIIKEREANNTKKKSFHLDPNLFLDVPGKTTTVNLVNLGQKKTLVDLSTGEEVTLRIRRKKVEARTQDDDYIGALPDDISKRLILFIKAGSEYKAYIKEASLNEIKVFLKEIKKGKSVKDNISFPEDLGENILQLEEEAEENNEKENKEEEETKDSIEGLAENLHEQEKDYIPFISSDSSSSDDEGEE